MSALSILNRYDFKRLRPGENDSSFVFKGPGLVVICQEEVQANGDETQFKMLTALIANNDALAVAKNALKQRAGREKYVFAMLASLATLGERQAALEALAPMCSEGI